MAARTLLAWAGGVWMWPGIALTETRGAASVPIAADVARFWITRLHGPEAIDSAVLRCLAVATQKLSEGDEAGAQRALDASGLTRLSSDGAMLACVVASSRGILCRWTLVLAGRALCRMSEPSNAKRPPAP